MNGQIKIMTRVIKEGSGKQGITGPLPSYDYQLYRTFKPKLASP